MWPFKKRVPEPVPIIVQAALEAMQHGEAKYGGSFLEVAYKGCTFQFQYSSTGNGRLCAASTDWIPWPRDLACRLDVQMAANAAKRRCNDDKRARLNLQIEELSKRVLLPEPPP